VNTTYEGVEAKAAYTRKNGNDQKEVRMIRMFVRHSVNDYATWREHYDAFDEERQSMGVTGHTVYQSVDDPNDVTVSHDFTTREAAETFSSSPRLREVMQKAGVAGTPDIWFVTEA
jgi:quinol monooxygenase YgiN